MSRRAAVVSMECSLARATIGPTSDTRLENSSLRVCCWLSWFSSPASSWTGSGSSWTMAWPHAGQVTLSMGTIAWQLGHSASATSSMTNSTPHFGQRSTSPCMCVPHSGQSNSKSVSSMLSAGPATTVTSGML